MMQGEMGETLDKDNGLSWHFLTLSKAITMHYCHKKRYINAPLPILFLITEKPKPHLNLHCIKAYHASLESCASTVSKPPIQLRASFVLKGTLNPIYDLNYMQTAIGETRDRDTEEVMR